MERGGETKGPGVRRRRWPRSDASALRRALAGAEYTVHYQPKIAVRTRAVVGVEALVRWSHPRRGLMRPADFLPVVEASPRLLSSMTSRVLECVLADSARWLREGRRLPVSVNIGRAELLSHPLADMVGDALKRHGVEPSLLTLEIPAAAIRDPRPETQTRLADLRRVGVAISLDDFDAAYSTPASLQPLDLDEVKINGTLIGRVATSEGDRQTAQLIVDVGLRLGLVVVAEGVEDDRTLAEITGLRCPVAQGFLFSRALPSGALLRWLDRQIVIGPYGPRTPRRTLTSGRRGAPSRRGHGRA